MRGSPRRLSQPSGLRSRTATLIAVGVVAASALSVAAPLVAPADALSAAQPTVVSPVPAAFTPDVNNGTVFAIGQVGSKIILGGNFSSVSPPSDLSTVYPLRKVFAFDASTGTIDTTGFVPTVNGEVDTIIPGPRHNEVYIGGQFTKVDGRDMRVALLDTNTGRIVRSWRPSKFNNTTAKLVLADDRLFVAGTFTTVGRATHRGLVALRPRTGKVTSYVDLSFSGHHNYGTKCNPKTAKCATGYTGVKAIDVNPTGTRLVAVGNFTRVSGYARDQVAMINLNKSSAAVTAQWSTLAYTSACFSQSFDSYVRDVQFSPNGSYLVIAATGGRGRNSDGTKANCDAAARFETYSVGSDIKPTWVDYTGEDSLWTVAVTGTAVYVGGHARWLNNPHGLNVAGSGAIPRPGIAALSPVSGLPLSWNPGRNPRGAGCFALLATSDGLWIGSDTDYIGNFTYFRAKVAFFPLAGGETLPADTTPTVPGRIYEVGATAAAAPDPDRAAFREFNGGGTGQEIPLDTGIAWGSVHGAFTVDGQVIYGDSDGNLYERAFDGTTFGPEVELDPFNDPTWDNVQTGSGQTYQGLASTFSTEIPTVTAMFFTGGRLYYTLAGQPEMHWRWFEPESGVVGAQEHTVARHEDWSEVSGAFLAGRTLYYADQATGELMALDWTSKGAIGTPRVVDASTDWASRGLFLLSQSTDPTPTPTASFTGDCGESPTCFFAAAPWADPDGGTVRYEWAFGDGTTQPLSSSPDASHRYATNGPHNVTLIVVDTGGASASDTAPVTVSAPVATVGFVGASTAAGRGSTVHLKVPRASARRDTLMLFDSYASDSDRVRAPSGWKLVGITRHHSLTTAVLYKVASAHEARRRVTVTLSKPASSTVILAVYKNVAVTPIERALKLVASPARSHPSPVLMHLRAGSWVVGYWTQVSRPAASLRPPHRLARRAAMRSHGRPHVAAVLADAGRARHGTYALGTARSGRRVRSAAQWAIALSPALV